MLVCSSSATTDQYAPVVPQARVVQQAIDRVINVDTDRLFLEPRGEVEDQIGNGILGTGERSKAAVLARLDTFVEEALQYIFGVRELLGVERAFEPVEIVCDAVDDDSMGTLGKQAGVGLAQNCSVAEQSECLGLSKRAHGFPYLNPQYTMSSCPTASRMLFMSAAVWGVLM